MTRSPDHSLFLVFLVRSVGLGLVVFPGVFRDLRVFGVLRFLKLCRTAVAFRGRGRRHGTGALLRVVRHVPARAFELHSWSRDHLFDDASAFGALSQLLIGELADSFKAMSTLLAQVFVIGHGLADFR